MTTPLVSTAELAEHPDRWTVIDASVAKTSAPGEAKAYRAARDLFLEEGHIPGARFADLIDRFSDPAARFPFTRPTAAQFEDAARELGISGRDRIVVYDRSSGIWAARLWWLFRAFGHGAVSVLDGGFLRWTREGRAVEHEAEPVRRGDVRARETDGFFVDTPAVVDIVAGRGPARLVNVLRRAVHTGHEQSYARPGHIPGSVNVPYAELLDPATNSVLPRDDLAARFAGILADAKPIVTYCGGGITAAGGALALAILGRSDVAVYDGSLNEWAADPGLPLVVDP